MSDTCNCCNHDDHIDDLVLKSLKIAIERYPEIIPYLTGAAAKIVEDGIEWHQKFEPYDGEYVYTPGKTDITQEDIDQAIAEWDRLMPDYVGLLDAEVRIDENAE